MHIFEAISTCTIVACTLHVEYLGYHKLVLVINAWLIYYLYLYHLRELTKARLVSVERQERQELQGQEAEILDIAISAKNDSIELAAESEAEVVAAVSNTKTLDSLALCKAKKIVTGTRHFFEC
jgi:hypothetical protein